MANKLREQVLGPLTNVQFEIRRVKIADYMRELKDLPFSMAPGTITELNKITEQIEKMPVEKQDELNQKSINLFLGKGVVRMKYPDEDWRAPNIWFGADDACPDDSVTVADLGSDADLVSGEIAALSFNLKGVKALEGFFREQQLPSPRPDSEEIRTEAVEPVAG